MLLVKLVKLVGAQMGVREEPRLAVQPRACGALVSWLLAGDATCFFWQLGSAGVWQAGRQRGAVGRLE